MATTSSPSCSSAIMPSQSKRRLQKVRQHGIVLNAESKINLDVALTVCTLARSRQRSTRSVQTVRATSRFDLRFGIQHDSVLTNF